MIYLATILSILLVVAVIAAVFFGLCAWVSVRALWISNRENDLLRQENATLEFLRQQPTEADWPAEIE